MNERSWVETRVPFVIAMNLVVKIRNFFKNEKKETYIQSELATVIHPELQRLVENYQKYERQRILGIVEETLWRKVIRGLYMDIVKDVDCDECEKTVDKVYELEKDYLVCHDCLLKRITESHKKLIKKIKEGK